MLKKILFQLHWFTGITAGLILAIMGVTGALFSYEKQLTRTIHPDSFMVQARHEPLLRPAQLYQRLSTHYPEQKIRSITVTPLATEAASVNFDNGTKHGITRTVNPYTAELLPEAQAAHFFKFVENIHRFLALGEFAKLWSDHPEQWRDYGRQLTGISAIALIYFVLSGIYLRWPKKSSVREWLELKKNLNGRSFLWNLHAVVGTWVVVFYLLLALTGLSWSYDWYRTVAYQVLGITQPATKQSTLKESSARQQTRQQPDLDIPLILEQSWQVFDQQMNSFSSASFKIPEHGSSIEITFFDAPQQHERARNTLTYNFVRQHVEELSFYRDKPLNKKIANSFLPVHRGSFFGSSWQFLTMLAALSMPLFFITGWMLYLKRRKQQKFTRAAQQLIPAASRSDPTRPDWLIVYASQTGFAEQLAWSTAQSLQHANTAARVVPMHQLSIEQLKAASHALFIVSTYGQGEPPDHARAFAKKQLKQTINLSQLNYAVLALGDQAYAQTYCAFGRQLDHWLHASKARALFERTDVNNGATADLQRWNDALSQLTRQTLEPVIVEKVFDDWQLLSRSLLNPNSMGEAAFEIRLSACHDASWHAGDIAEIQPGNSNAQIQEFIGQHALDADVTVRQNNSSTTLFEALRYINLRDRIPHKIAAKTANAQQFIDQLADLDITLVRREYSIASIPSDGYLGLVVRQSQSVQGLGLGSGWLTAHAPIDHPIRLRVRSNPSFHAPDDNRPVILIGNGTGIAGLMSILKERKQRGFGRNWLIFGEREQQKDFFFAAQLEQWLNDQHIERLDLAFSRDQQQRIYVQHRLAEQAELLAEWVAQGASIYVCGSIEGMAPAVEQVLIDVLGEELLEQLRANGHYCRDVY